MPRFSIGDVVICKLPKKYDVTTRRGYDGMVAKVIALTRHGNIDMTEILEVPPPASAYKVGRKCSLGDEFWKHGAILTTFKLSKDVKL